MQQLQKYMVLGVMRERSPGIRRLTIWAKTKLHHSFKCLIIRDNNYIELQFTQEEGIRQTLSTYSYRVDNRELCCNPWSPYYEEDELASHKQLKTALWAQMIGLLQSLRTKEFLHQILHQTFEILLIDDGETCRAKLFGPRVRILTDNTEDLPRSVWIMRMDADSEKEYMIEYSGFSGQCSRCRSYEDQRAKGFQTGKSKGKENLFATRTRQLIPRNLQNNRRIAESVRGNKASSGSLKLNQQSEKNATLQQPGTLVTQRPKCTLISGKPWAGLHRLEQSSQMLSSPYS